MRSECSPDIPDDIMIVHHEVLVLFTLKIFGTVLHQICVTSHSSRNRLCRPLVSLVVSLRLRGVAVDCCCNVEAAVAVVVDNPLPHDADQAAAVGSLLQHRS